MEGECTRDIKKGWFERRGRMAMTKISLLQLSLALGLGMTLTGCQTMSDVGSGVSDAASSVGDMASGAVASLDPTTWFGDDTPTATADNAATDADARTSPDLANLPSRPATTAPAQQQAAAQSLAADGAQARYSADALRAGTEAAAAPPGAADMPPSAQLAMADAPPTTDVAPSAQAPAPRPAAPVAASAPPPSALTQGTAAVPVAGVPVAAAPMSAASPAAVAAARPAGAQPAVPANTPVRGATFTGSRVASDAQLGFRPSAAPPLDPSISQWVPQPVMARYRQTASIAGVAPVRVAAVPQKGAAASPEVMSGAVMSNFDAVSAPGAGIAGVNGGSSASATVYFPGDGTTLSTAARTEIRNAVTQYKSMGGAGSIRVVGHASSRTANMPVEKHLETIFQKSQARANAVAQELIREGVPAARVLIDAVGDSQPVYYESMPQGEEGNRRAEIFLQG